MPTVRLSATYSLLDDTGTPVVIGAVSDEGKVLSRVAASINEPLVAC